MIARMSEFNRDLFSDADLARLDLIGTTFKWIHETWGETDAAAMVIGGHLLSIAKEICEASE
jgi:hypothetical protein